MDPKLTQSQIAPGGEPEISGPVTGVGVTAGFAPAPKSPAAPTLSYSALHEHARCGYRFYVERILGVPPTPESAPGPLPGAANGGRRRGTEVHESLQRLDFRRPVIPGGTSPQVADLLRAFAGSTLRRRLAAATDVMRERSFAFPFADSLVTGTFDVLATEDPGRLLVVDYKSDRLDGVTPAALVDAEYRTQRLIYAIAALHQATAIAAAGGWSVTASHQVEVVHLFLEAPEDPASQTYEAGDLPDLERELEQVSAALRAGVFEVAARPRRAICHGCPAEGGLCSWSADLTRRS